MNEFSAFIRPLIALIFIWTGYRRLRYPIKFLPKPAESSAATLPPDLLSQAPSSQHTLAKLRIVGALWLILGIMLLIISPIHFRLSSPKPASAAGTSTHTASALAIQQLASNYVATHKIPNLSVAIIGGGAEHIFSFGTTSLFNSEPVDENTLFEIGSITKVFTGLLLARMVHEQRLSLDDPLSKFLPRGADLSNPAQNIYLRHLATHTAGLPMMPPNYMSFTRTLRIFAGLDPYNTYSESNSSHLSPISKSTPPSAKKRNTPTMASRSWAMPSQPVQSTRTTPLARTKPSFAARSSILSA